MLQEIMYDFSIGYMPQSLALHIYFSCKEILSYYCCIHGLDDVKREERIKFLLKTLKMSDKVLISPTFYDQLYRMRVSCDAFTYLRVCICSFLSNGVLKKS